MVEKKRLRWGAGGKHRHIYGEGGWEIKMVVRNDRDGLTGETASIQTTEDGRSG